MPKAQQKGEGEMKNARTFAFGSFQLIPERQLLLQDGTSVRIGSRALDLLAALVERPGELVTKRELMERAWPNTLVDESNLKVNMASLRRVLDDGVAAVKYIATVTGRGYRFIAPVLTTGSPAERGLAVARAQDLVSGTTQVFGTLNAIETIRVELDQSRLASVIRPGALGNTTVTLAIIVLIGEDRLGPIELRVAGS